MKTFIILTLCLFIFSCSGKNPVSSVPTTPQVETPIAGALSVQLTNYIVKVTWTKSTDNDTPEEELQYKVVYSKIKTDIDTLEKAKECTQVVTDWTTTIEPKILKTLDTNSLYYFMVIVKDKSENMSLYEIQSIRTLSPIAILKKGISVWNQWRKDNPNVKPNLRNANLYQAYLGSVNFSNTDLSGANLNKSNLRRANLSNAILHKTYLNNSNAMDINLSNANMNNVYCSNASLMNAKLNNANLTNAYIEGTNFLFASFRGANFTGARINNSNLANASIDEKWKGWVQARRVYGFVTIRWIR